jgi:hypothetical protein
MEETIQNKDNKESNKESNNVETEIETLSKSELRKIENEKRNKRINELMTLIDKTSLELNSYQNELWDLLKTITSPQTQQKPKKERIKDIDIDAEGDSGKDSGKERRNRSRSENKRVQEQGQNQVQSEDNSKKKSGFERFFKPSIEINLEAIDELQKPISTPNSTSNSVKKQRARAVSYDEVEQNIKKKRLENFEVVDIYQLEGVEVPFVRECLEKCDINGDIKLFRKLFIKNIPKDEQIIRFLGGKNYQTKRNGLWIDDPNAIYIKYVISKILEKSYMIANDLEHYGSNIDQFVINQDHITQLDDDKYIEKLILQINTIIDIKNNKQ